MEKLDSRLVMVPTTQNGYEEAELQGLAESIKNTGGLVHPVLVDKTGKVLHGRRRMAAAKKNGETVVLGIRLNSEGVDAELEAIRIRLLQKKTAVLYRAEDLGTWKAHYDKQHPEQTKGGNQELKKAKKEQNGIIPFCQMVASETDSSISSIEKLLKISRIKPDVRAEIHKNEELENRQDRLLQTASCEKKYNVPQMEMAKMWSAHPNWTHYDCVNEIKKQENLQQGKSGLVPDAAPPRYQIIQGDFREVLPQMLADGTLPEITTIITDPPYSKPHLYLLPAFAQLAAQVLPSTGGVAAVMFGQAYLNVVVRELDKAMQYRWIMAEDFGEPGVTLHGINMANHWKPILVYANHSHILPGYAPDIIRTKWGNEKEEPVYDDWQQCRETFEKLVLRFTKPGDWILDPFLGTGTTMIAALKHGRRCIGIDIDPQKTEITKMRLQKELGI